MDIFSYSPTVPQVYRTHESVTNCSWVCSSGCTTTVRNFNRKENYLGFYSEGSQSGNKIVTTPRTRQVHTPGYVVVVDGQTSIDRLDSYYPCQKRVTKVKRKHSFVVPCTQDDIGILETDELLQKLRYDANSLIVKHRSDAMTALAEMRKTFEGFNQKGMQLYRGLSRLRKGDVFGAIRSLSGDRKQKSAARRRPNIKRKFTKQYGSAIADGLADNWLFYRYGWSPFQIELKNMCRQHIDWLTRREFRGKSHFDRVSESGDVSVANHHGPKVWGTDNPYYYTVTSAYWGITRTKTKCKIWWRVRPDWGSLAQGAVTHNISFPGVAVTAWELVPFSFFADSFVDMGSWLRSKSAFHGMSFIDGGYSIEKFVNDTGFATSPLGASDKPYQASRYYYARHPLDQFGFSYNIFDDLFRNDWHWRQTLDVAAMLRSRKSGIPKYVNG